MKGNRMNLNVPRVIFTSLIITAFLLGMSSLSLAGPGCSKSKAKTASGCDVTKCAAAVACGAKGTEAQKINAATCTKETCVKECMAKGMTEAEAVACWEQHLKTGHTKCLGKTEGNVVQSANAVTPVPGSADAKTAGCPMMTKANVVQKASTESCTKDQCIAKMIESGMTKEAAEKHYAECKTTGQCTKSCGSTAIKTTESKEINQ